MRLTHKYPFGMEYSDPHPVLTWLKVLPHRLRRINRIDLILVVLVVLLALTAWGWWHTLQFEADMRDVFARIGG